MIEYRMRGKAVVVYDGFGDFAADEPSLRQAIENIRANREDYATTAEWSAHLAKYEGALAFLTAHLDAQP